MKKQKSTILITNIAIGVVIFMLSAVLSAGDLTYMSYGLAIAVVVGTFPFLILSYLDVVNLRKTEEFFPDFLRDLAEAKSSGMTLPKAISLVSKTNYGPLSKDVKKMAVQISWGVPFPKVLKAFRKRNYESIHIRRGVSIILAAYLSGGNLTSTMDRVAKSTRKLVEGEKDRKSKISGQISILYAVHFVFLGILVILYQFIVPLLEVSFSTSLTSFFTAQTITLQYYRFLFFGSALMFTLGNGFIIGVSSEGKISAGAKYMLILLIGTTLVFSIFILPKIVVLNVNPLQKDTYLVGEDILLSGSFYVDKVAQEQATVELSCLDERTLTRTVSDGIFSDSVSAPSKTGLIKCNVEARHGSAYAKKTFKINVI